MSETYRRGDRVRITYVHDGEVIDANEVGVAIKRDGIGDTWYHHYIGGQTGTVEKIQDPEPEWVNGDVIEVPSTFYGPRIVARINGEWRFTDIGDKAGPHLIGNHWPDIEILYKADAAYDGDYLS